MWRSRYPDAGRVGSNMRDRYLVVSAVQLAKPTSKRIQLSQLSKILICNGVWHFQMADSAIVPRIRLDEYPANRPMAHRLRTAV
jgi:hypothetical protein